MGKKNVKTKDMKLDNWIRNTQRVKPYVTPEGRVMWGTPADNSRKKGVLAKESRSNEEEIAE